MRPRKSLEKEAFAPGRVNLIGEHIDYSGYGVLPMALDLGTRTRCRLDEPDAASKLPGPVSAAALRFSVSSSEDAQFPPGGPFTVDPSTVAGDGASSTRGWHSYVHCGVIAGVRLASEIHADREGRIVPETAAVAGAAGDDGGGAPGAGGRKGTAACRGAGFAADAPIGADAAPFLGARGVHLTLFVQGNMPRCAGLSSSSSLVCSVASAVCAALLDDTNWLGDGAGGAPDAAQRHWRVRGAFHAMVAERLTGVMGGGMDQTASMTSERGSASKIDFEPEIRSRAVALPPSAVFVVADSCVSSAKVVDPGMRYNLRAVECALAAAVLGLSGRGGDGGGGGVAARLADRKRPTLAWAQSANGWDGLDDAVSPRALAALERGGDAGARWTLDDAASVIGRDIAEGCLRHPLTGQPATAVREFALRDRAAHVYAEARRVEAFEALCRAAASDGGDEGDTLRALGALMNESHASCRDLYDCSCSELDDLTRIAREEGALGSRLTGAGWGGCTVSLVLRGSEDKFIARIKERFYAPRGIHDPTIFATSPGCGATVVRVVE